MYCILSQYSVVVLLLIYSGISLTNLFTFGYEIRNETVSFSQTFSWCRDDHFLGGGWDCKKWADPIFCQWQSEKETNCWTQGFIEDSNKDMVYSKNAVELSVRTLLQCPHESPVIYITNVRYIIPREVDRYCEEIVKEKCDNSRDDHCKTISCSSELPYPDHLLSLSKHPPKKWRDQCLSSTTGKCQLSIEREKISEVSDDCVPTEEHREYDPGFSYCYSRWVEITYLCMANDNSAGSAFTESTDIKTSNIITDLTNSGHGSQGTTLPVLVEGGTDKQTQGGSMLLVIIVAVVCVVVTSLIWLIILIICRKFRKKTDSASKSKPSTVEYAVINHQRSASPKEQETTIAMTTLNDDQTEYPSLSKNATAPIPNLSSRSNNDVNDNDELVENNYYEGGDVQREATPEMEDNLYYEGQYGSGAGDKSEATQYSQVAKERDGQGIKKDANSPGSDTYEYTYNHFPLEGRKRQQ